MVSPFAVGFKATKRPPLPAQSGGQERQPHVKSILDPTPSFLYVGHSIQPYSTCIMLQNLQL